MWPFRSGLMVPQHAALSAGAAASLLDGSESDGTNLLGAGPAAFTSGWSTLDATLTANAASDPAGGSAAATVRETSGAPRRHGIYRQPSFTAGTSHTYSVYALSVTRQYMVLFVAGSASSAKLYAYFDVINGTVTDSGILNSSGSSIGTPTIEAAVGGFFKCSIPSAVVDSSSGNPYLQYMCSDVATYGAPLESDNPQFAGSTSTGLNLWRPKVV